jgi:hypothetical protein
VGQWTPRYTRLTPTLTAHVAGNAHTGRQVPQRWQYLSRTAARAMATTADATQDMATVLAVLDGIAVAAEPTRATGGVDQGVWTLCVHWLQNGPVSSETEAALPAALARIRDHFVTRERTPPARLELRGADHEVLLTIESGTAVTQTN